MMTRLRLNHGFTLVEALIAVAVLMVGVLILEKNFIAAVLGNNSAKLTTASVAEASRLLEELQSLDWSFTCNGSDLRNGCVDTHARANMNNIDNMTVTVDAAGNVLSDLAVTWNANGQRVSTPHGQPLPANAHHGNIAAFINICQDCPPAAGVPPIDNTRLIRVISRYRDPGRPSGVAGNDPLFQRTQQNQATVLEYVKAQAN